MNPNQTSSGGNLSRGDGAGDERLLEAIEFYRRELDAGRCPARHELLAKYRDVADELAECLDSLDFVYQIAPALRDTDDATQRVHNGLPDRACLGDFRIEREIGRGGMGVVYSAEQLSLGRQVALKVLPFASMLDSRQLERFQNEAKATASLKHPRIVSVLSIGYERGVHYYAMELVEGESLAKVIRRTWEWDRLPACRVFPELARLEAYPTEAYPTQTLLQRDIDTVPQPMRLTCNESSQADFLHSAARLMMEVSEAIDYAHQMGIVHRDIKPSNLVLDRDGHLWVTDFGLAMTQARESLTVTGDIPGTLRYMSPEQAMGQRSILDHRTDIYSLGATLYELITGRAAIDGEDRQAILRNIIDREPLRPRQYNPAIPRDLETIVLKAMAKDAAQRYQTAAELADDLRRFVADEPVRARRTRSIDRLWRWSRRNRRVATLLMAFLTLLGFTAVAGPLIAVRQTQLAQREKQSRQEAVQARDELRRLLCVSDTHAAYTAFHRHDLDLTRKLLYRHAPPEGENTERDFAWRLLHGMLQQAARTPTLHHPGEVNRAVFSPDGQLAATACVDGLVRLWICSDWTLMGELRGHQAEVGSVSFTPNGSELVSGSKDGKVVLWDVATMSFKETLFSCNGKSTVTALSPEGEKLAVVVESHEYAVILIDLATRTQKSIASQLALIPWVGFSLDGGLLAVASVDRTVRLWDVETGNLRHEFHDPFECYSAVFIPGGQLIATAGSDRWITLWDIESGSQRRRFAGHHPGENKLACSPDGSILATGSLDGIIRLWNADSGELLDTIAAHSGDIQGLAVSPDGRVLLSCSRDRTAKVWRLTERLMKHRTANPVEGWYTALGISPDGSMLAVGTGPVFVPNATGSLSLWEVRTARLRYSFGLQSDPVISVAFSPVSPLLATGGGQVKSFGQVRIWDARTGELLRELSGHTDQVAGMAFSPDGNLLASASLDGSIRLWNAWTGVQLQRFTPMCQDGQPFLAVSLSFSPDGSLLAVAGGQWQLGEVKLWEVATGREIDTLAMSGNIAGPVCFSSNGEWLFAGEFRRNVFLWRVVDRTLMRTFKSRSLVAGFAVSPDGKILATGGREGDVTFWDVATGGQLGEVWTVGGVFSVCFAPDGNTLIAGSSDKRITLWRAPANSLSGEVSSMSTFDADSTTN